MDEDDNEQITRCEYRDDCTILIAYRKDRYMSGVVEGYCMENPEACPRHAFRKFREEHGWARI